MNHSLTLHIGVKTKEYKWKWNLQEEISIYFSILVFLAFLLPHPQLLNISLFSLLYLSFVLTLTTPPITHPCLIAAFLSKNSVHIWLLWTHTTWFNYWKCYIFFWFSTQGTYPTTVLEFFICVHVFSHFSHVRFFVTLWSVAHRAPLSMGFFQIRILEWVSIPSSKGSSQARIQNCTSCTVGRFFTTEPLGKPEFLMTCLNNFFFCAEKVIKRPTFLNDRKLYSL